MLLASGHGAVVGPESGVRDGEFLVALDVMAGRPGEVAEARIRMASTVDRSWLTPTHTRVDHVFDRDAGVVRAMSRDYYDALVLVERPAPADPDEVERLLVDAYLVEAARARRTSRFCAARGSPASPSMFERWWSAPREARARSAISTVERGLTGDERRRLDEMAPQTIGVPSGREARLEYQADGSVSAAVKLQELFGLADTPRVGPRRDPVLLALLAPNGRPVQMTRDLRSFWERTYPEVRKELRGRYPKHPWPEDPWTAQPTARTTRRGVK